MSSRLRIAAVVSLAFASHQASAAALGGLAASLGAFTALGALLLVKAWPAGLPASGWPTIGAVLLIAGAAAWLWRTRGGLRVSALMTSNGGVATVAHPLAAAEISLPVALDRNSLMTELRLQFVTLQSAWDQGETAVVAGLTTPGMLRELMREPPGYGSERKTQRSDVVWLRAELLGFEDLTGALVATVEFSGLMREGPEHGADPFRELWMLTKAKEETEGWRLARHQAFL